MQKKLSYTILAIAAVLMFFTSCQKDENWNSTDAVVNMGKATYNVKESKGLFSVPVAVTGEQNGDIEVTVEVVANDPKCVEDTHYIVTSKKVIIPASKKEVNIEVKAIDDRIINEDRSFTIKIANAKGAKIGTETTTLVTLMDNDDIPYDRMDGIWIVTANENGQTVSWETKLSTIVDEDEEGYGTQITMSPWMVNGQEVYDIISLNLKFSYNTSSQTASVEFLLGDVMAEELDFRQKEEETNLASCTLRSATTTATGYKTNGSITGAVNEDFTKITLDSPLVGLIYDTNDVLTYMWFYYTDIVLTRK